MNVKTQFSIKDLENLSSVKAHTIRIWEKRYNLFEPNRTETNIRTYNLHDLVKLLNICTLSSKGYKISKIVQLKESEIQHLVEELTISGYGNSATNAFKTSMFEFDEQLFSKTFEKLIQKKSLREIFMEVFLPLLNDIGTLWQTGTINPCHESFISELIKRKIIVSIERKISNFNKTSDTLIVLFLPYKEIHEIGLLYTNYEVLASGHKTIYLGTNIPLDNLINLLNVNDKIIFISYITMHPEGKNIYDYISNYQELVYSKKPCDLWLLGNKAQLLDRTKIPLNIHLINELPDLISRLESLKNL